MATYEQVHAGDLVLGHDREIWGVEAITHAPTLAVTLTRYGTRVTGYPPGGTEVTIVQSANVTAELSAAQALIGCGFNIEVVSEFWKA